jgi:hypothetical protein
LRNIKLYPAVDTKLKTSLFREVMRNFVSQGCFSMAGYREPRLIKLAVFQELKLDLLKKAYSRRPKLRERKYGS